jgi:transposase-like protein
VKCPQCGSFQVFKVGPNTFTSATRKPVEHWACRACPPATVQNHEGKPIVVYGNIWQEIVKR